MRIPNNNCITAYLHCALCLQELPSGISPKEWSRTQTGFTELGLQIWCNRHEVNVAHINFQGQQHPANLDRAADTKTPHQVDSFVDRGIENRQRRAERQKKNKQS
jgi:hypothetical protein